MATANCNNCFYYRQVLPTVTINGRTAGRCCVVHPVAVPAKMDASANAPGAWPLVRDIDWCGEWKAQLTQWDYYGNLY